MNKRIHTKLIQRLPYIAKYVFKKSSAYEIGKEIYKRGLTKISHYPYCGNHDGELAIYQWVYQFKKCKPFNCGFKFRIYNSSMGELKKKTNEELIKRIKELEKQNERLKKGIRDRDEAITIVTEIVKENLPEKLKKVEIDEKIKKHLCSLSINKLYNLLGLCRRNYYYISNKKEKKISGCALVLHNIVKSI
jgi:hypothetical protein